jgi:hypothetical protein
MRERLLRGLIAIVLVLAFVGDLRVVAPAAAGAIALAAWRHLLPWSHAAVAAGVLAAATVAFEVDRQVTAWTLVLVVAAVAGLTAATATGGSVADRRVAGSSNRAG